MDSEKSRDTRTRNFATVVYPESAPENWQDILARHCVPAFISPLHDKDINPTGEPKKPHYHVVLMFEGKKSISQVTEIFNTINGVGCEVVKSLRGYARYLCHLDNPEKAQYEPSEVRCIASDYIGTIGLAIDKYVAIGEMQDFCEQYNIVSFYALAKYARGNRPDWHRILCDCGSVYMREYLQSRKWSVEQNYGDIIDPETGEIIQ
jgi:Plasmid replication protein